MLSQIDPRVMHAIYRLDFASFIRRCFRTLVPGSVLQMNWHIYALAFALEQVRLGKIRRLIINMPPRSLKSLITSVSFPSFVLGHDPTKAIIVVSYGSDLAIKLANDCRVILNAPWYRELFPAMRISSLKNTEFEVVTTQHGLRLATSIDGTLTGRGGDILILELHQRFPAATTHLRAKPPPCTNDVSENLVILRLETNLTRTITRNRPRE